jgi:endoglucanase
MRSAWGTAAGIATVALVLVFPLAGTAAPSPLDPATRFFVPAPSPAATSQVIGLVRQGRLRSALQVGAMLAQGHAVWFTDGAPADVERQVHKTMVAAAVERRVPVLVAYDLPFRDCGQYSAGGALGTADYLAWIDGFARGIGNGQAVVILEPDGLGIIPYNTTIYGASEWCRPDLTGTGLTPAQANQSRYDQLNAAVDRLEQQPKASVYLDGTHAAWLGVGEAAYRLAKAGALRAQGFFLNVSNYQTTPNSLTFGRWVSKCIAFATNPAEGGWRLGNYSWCPSQYNPATGFTVDYSPAYAASVDAQLDGLRGDAAPTTRFVVDTSRNGLGPWTPTASYPDAQDWCNPPHRGVGLRPTAATGDPLADAFLWVKVPGESDGQCSRGLGPTGTVDPEWGLVDPPAGGWFPQQALELAQLASPALVP